jgi:hypothetical protein
MRAVAKQACLSLNRSDAVIVSLRKKPGFLLYQYTLFRRKRKACGETGRKRALKWPKNGGNRRCYLKNLEKPGKVSILLSYIKIGRSSIGQRVPGRT